MYQSNNYTTKKKKSYEKLKTKHHTEQQINQTEPN